jgi:DNA-binding NarL/FixJ family response regulator
MPGFHAPPYLIRQSKVLAALARAPIERPFQVNSDNPESRIKLFGKRAVSPMLFYLKHSNFGTIKSKAPGKSGVDPICHLHRQHPGLAILVLTMDDETQYAVSFRILDRASGYSP